MNVAGAILLGVTLAWACIERAGVVPQDWNPCVLAIAIVAAIYFLFPHRRRIPRFDPLLAACVWLVLGLAAFQLAPLPLSVVRFLSPARAELVRAAAPVAGGLPHFITLTAAPYASAEALLTLASYVAVFLLVREMTLRMDRFPWVPVWPIIVVATLEAALGFIQTYAQVSDQATGTYNSRDHYAGLLEMVLPFSAMYAVAILRRNLRPKGMPVRAALEACGMMISAGLLLIAVVFAISRMGFFCSLAALILAGLLALSVRGWRDDDRVKPLWRRAMPAAMVAAVALAGVVILPSAALVSRFSDLAHTDDITADTRAQLWRDTVPLIEDYAWFGCGFGAYESCFYKYKTVAPMSTADFAHNDYLQVMAELGVVAFAAGLVFVLRILIGAGRNVLYAHSIDERFRSIACVAAMTAMLLHSLVDFNMYVPANAMVFAWIAGVASVSLVRRGSAESAREPAPLPGTEAWAAAGIGRLRHDG
jgi:O-antigen ligase